MKTYQSESCYFCGRTRADYHIFFESILERIDSDIVEKEHAIQAQVSSRDAEESRRNMVLSEYKTVDEAKLDLKIATIKTDVSTFRSLIPFVDDIIEFSDKCSKKGEDLDVRGVLDEVSGFGYERWEQTLKRLHADLEILELKRAHVDELASDEENLSFEQKSFRVEMLFRSGFFQLDKVLQNGVSFMKDRFRREPVELESLLSQMIDESEIRAKNSNSAHLPNVEMLSEKRKRLLQSFLEVSQLEFQIAICPICSSTNQEILRRAQSN